MRKSFVLCGLLSLALCLPTIPVSASPEWYVDENVLYFSNDIPDSSIGKAEWYQYADEITSIVIGDGCKRIGSNAFYGFTALKSVSLGSVESIGEAAFQYCESLEAIELPQSLKTLDNRAFYCCESLSDIGFCGSLTSVGAYAFCLTPWLNDYPSDFVSCDGILCYYKGNGEFIAFPDEVSYIGSGAFVDSLTVKAVSLDGIVGVLSGGFEDCMSLESITIPAGVELGDSAFKNCFNIYTLRIADGVEIIPDYCFSGCVSMVALELPSSVSELGDYCFECCSSLPSVSLNGAESIGVGAFSGCTSLGALILSENLLTVGDEAFLSCDISSVALPLSLEKIGSNAFGYAKFLGTSTASADFSIYAFGGEAELYAEENGFDYISLIKNSIDELRILQYCSMTQATPMTPNELLCADGDCDGILTAFDAYLAMLY